MPSRQILRHLNKITVFLTYNLQMELSLKVHSYSIEREMSSAIYQNKLKISMTIQNQVSSVCVSSFHYKITCHT